jgi:hypothetical protein
VDPQPANSVKPATSVTFADGPSSKTAIDFFEESFINWNILHGSDEDADFEVDDALESSDSEDDEDDVGEDIEGKKKDKKEKDRRGIAETNDESIVSADGDANHLDFDEGNGIIGRATELNRNTEYLVKEFHQADINIAEKEAAEKRRDGYVKLFLHADRVYTSPLTRAMQTALLSMEGHRAVEQDGFTLYR